MYLLDTNTLIYYFKGKGKVAVRLLQAAPREVAVSTITVYELEVGLAKTNAPHVRRAQLEDFLAFVTVLLRWALSLTMLYCPHDNRYVRYPQVRRKAQGRWHSRGPG